MTTIPPEMKYEEIFFLIDSVSSYGLDSRTDGLPAKTSFFALPLV